MKMFVTLERGQPHSIHWTKEGADRASVVNQPVSGRRDVHEVELKINEADGSYFVAMAKLLELSSRALDLVNVLESPRGSVFETISKASVIAVDLKRMKSDFIL